VSEFEAVTIPADAARACQCGATLESVPGTVHADEGDGAAMVDLKCSAGCGVSSYHSWALPDEEFETVFGYPFGERPDDEDD
jgi:hypothetical protein